MPFPRRLDAALIKLCRLTKKEARAAIREGRVTLNGVHKLAQTTPVTKFSRIALDGKIVYQQKAYYVMLNKPAGAVSARRDAENTCVVDVLARDGKPLPSIDTGAPADDDRLVTWRGKLSIAGRLDRWTTGLLLLTNDGHFMRRITDGTHGKVEKEYRVTTLVPIPDLDATMEQFSNGLYLPDNQRICRPAQIACFQSQEEVAKSSSSVKDLASGFDRTYTITLCEGKRHQIKCMIHAISGGQNRVIALHRTRIGKLVLDEESLPPGAWRFLTPEEVGAFDLKAATS